MVYKVMQTGKETKWEKSILLPIYKINNKYYFRDERLGEYRNVKNVMDKIPINDFPKLQTPTKKDKIKLFGR